MIWTTKDAAGGPHALVIYLRLGEEAAGEPEDDEPFYELDDRLRETLESSGAGEFDGHEWGAGYFAAFMYGPDADRLFDAVAPVILAFPAPRGSYVVKRYGGLGSNVRVVNL